MFEFQPITEKYADEILSWKYQNEYSCYDTSKNESTLEKLMLEESIDFFAAIIDDDELAGFAEATFDENGVLEVGCGLLPSYLRRGLGFDFVSSCIEYLVEYFDYNKDHLFTLIKPEDKHAIKVFERVGFYISDESEEWVELTIDI